MIRPIVILGCTASGKSDLAEGMARRLGARVMAVDSMQVYRGMDIGTAKPSAATRAEIPHLMIDVADPWETYSAARFVEEAKRVLGNSGGTGEREGGPVVMVTGTILYLRGLVEGFFEGPGADEQLRAELHRRAEEIGLAGLHEELRAVDPVAAGRIHRNDLRRMVRAMEVYRLTGTAISALQTQWSREHPGMEAVYIGIRRDKESLNRRINARVKGMMEAGLVEEVRRLAEDRRGFSQEASSGVGYRQLLDHFARRCSLADAVEQIKIQTRHLAKMQRTWLKRWPAPPPSGPAGVQWMDAGDEESNDSLVDRAMGFLENR